ncbi:rod-binding protein [Primorskyibacter flagellatus]|uniref:Rod binding protein n=1 Tax=Primorskyibacter flagellatus TaxID=1387277 RepID=A0A1W2EPB0_9RHOB|nr:rod-binding protein [Primorskyibacter flagellatus]SMD11106.1 Rod binding protein [Primorskyibacter flagellatus]
MLVQSIHPRSISVSPGDTALMAASRELEAQFLSEMLKAAGLAEAPDSFGGGAGEAQFSSFLRMEQARAITQSGGIGLAETIFHALKERQDG